jgi:outer membrane protein assembly factor BamB
MIGLRWNPSASEEEFGVINTTTGSFTVKGTVGDLEGLSCPSIISGDTLYVSGTNSSAQSKLYILHATTGSLISTVNLSEELALTGDI